MSYTAVVPGRKKNLGGGRIHRGFIKGKDSSFTSSREKHSPNRWVEKQAKERRTAKKSA